MKKIKGFTLLECLIAMALIGITSLLMVQVYGTVAMMNKDNNMMNNSIERQMQYAEKQLTEVANSSPDKDAVKIVELSSYGKTGADGEIDKDKGGMEIEMASESKTMFGSSFYVDEYTCPYDLYVIGIEKDNADGQAVDDYARGTVAKYYDDNNVRYKFIKPKPHPPTT